MSEQFIGGGTDVNTLVHVNADFRCSIAGIHQNTCDIIRETKTCILREEFEQ